MSAPGPVEPATMPPSGFDPNALPPEHTAAWPKVIGVFSLIYAIGGMLCSVALSVWTAFIGTFLAKLMQADVTLPLGVKIAYIALGTANLILGVMMILGAIALLQRKRKGVSLLLRWAVLRMVLLLVGAVVNVACAQSQIDMQQAMVESGNKRMIENGMEPNPVPSDEDLYRTHVINTAVATGLFGLYPFILGLYLSRRKIKEQIAHWPSR